MDSVPNLKTLSPRHLDIIRRLIVAQNPREVSIELGISQSRISALRGDPLFDAVYRDMQHRVNEGFIEVRASAMQILEDAAPHAARMARDAIISGEIKYEDGVVEKVPLPLRLKSAWDCLVATGNKAPEKHLVGHVDLGELISVAYKKKHHGKDNGGGVSNSQSIQKVQNSDLRHDIRSEKCTALMVI